MDSGAQTQGLMPVHQARLPSEPFQWFHSGVSSTANQEALKVTNLL